MSYQDSKELTPVRSGTVRFGAKKATTDLTPLFTSYNYWYHRYNVAPNLQKKKVWNN
jgi:hypothetical protein